MVQKALEAADRNGKLGWLTVIGMMITVVGILITVAVQSNKMQRDIQSDISRAVEIGVSRSLARSYPMGDGQQLEVRVETAYRQMRENTDKLNEISDNQVRMDERLKLILKEVKK